MTYRPGDNWIICDISGRKVLMSESRKTWDKLRVHPDYWDPKHPQLSVRGIPDHPGVIDGRPRTADVYVYLTYGYGSFCLISQDGSYWTFWADDDGALVGTNVLYGNPVPYIDIYNYRFTVDNDGALHLTSSPSPLPDVLAWRLVSPGGTTYQMTVGADGAVFLTES